MKRLVVIIVLSFLFSVGAFCQNVAEVSKLHSDIGAVGIVSQATSGNSGLEWISPAFLQPGDSVGLMTISSPLEENEEEAKEYIDIIRSWGLKVRYGENLFSHSYMAFSNTDSLRAAEFEHLLCNDNLKAIIMYRGGSGSARTVKYLDLSLIRKHPKLLLGFSDVTTYLNIYSNLHVESIHAAMLNSFIRPSRLAQGARKEIYPQGVDSTALSSRDALFGRIKGYNVAPHKYNRPGCVEGRLVGGNMSIMSISYGTPYELQVDDESILFIEEVGEGMNTCDRYMTQLKNSGKLSKVKAIVVGRFRNIKDSEDDWGSVDIYELIDSYTHDLGIPVLFWMRSGHGLPNFALYMGKKVRISVSETGGSIEFL